MVAELSARYGNIRITGRKTDCLAVPAVGNYVHRREYFIVGVIDEIGRSLQHAISRKVILIAKRLKIFSIFTKKPLVRDGTRG
jgi:hypothetical protein